MRRQWSFFLRITAVLMWQCSFFTENVFCSFCSNWGPDCPLNWGLQSFLKTYGLPDCWCTGCSTALSLISDIFQFVTYPKSLNMYRNKVEAGRQSFYFAGGSLYNSLPQDIRKIDDLSEFKKALRGFFLWPVYLLAWVGRTIYIS